MPGKNRYIKKIKFYNMNNYKGIENIKQKIIFTFLFFIIANNLSGGQADFGAYYTKINNGHDWENYSRTGEFADIIVQLKKAGGQLVFWRGNSYLPYWKTSMGQWDLTEIIPRRGDGTKQMPDRANIFSHVEIIENTSNKVVIHWRYLAAFSPGNPFGDLDPKNFTDEVFTITPDGKVIRIVKKATDKTDEWNDPLNQTTQVLQLNGKGFIQKGLTLPYHSAKVTKITGNPEKEPAAVLPAVWFKFDEGYGDLTREWISGENINVQGHKTLWKRGISGTTIEFDGYSTSVSLPVANSSTNKGDNAILKSKLNTGNITLEAWFALGAYPWNWVPIVEQGDDDGFFLGIDSKGYPGFMAKINGWWHQLTVPNSPPFNDPNHLGLFRWYHIAGVYNKFDGFMRLYINGKEIASHYAGPGGLESVNTDIRIGKAGVLRQPTESTGRSLPVDYAFDGLIDEVKIYDVAMTPDQVAELYKNYYPGQEIINSPDMQKRKFPYPDTKGQFRAEYTHLPYYESWENMWCFGPYADVIVGFDQLPVSYVFWHGVSYVPMMVNDLNQWYTNEFCETGFTAGADGDCEPMSDKGCWDSHVRIIENTGARVVVQWRYRLGNPGHKWGFYDADSGWGDIADWYFYIYPDGVITKRMRCYTSRPDYWHEWDEQIVVLGDGQTPGSVIEKEPVMTLVDSAGNAFEYNWITSPPDPDYKGKIIQNIHLTGKYSPYTIQRFNGGDVYSGEVTWYSVTPSWNHWPTAQINSSGRNASFPDRAAHSSISHLFWPYSLRESGKITMDEMTLMEGMTDQPPASLTSLAWSWLKAPAVINVSGGISMGYDQYKRTYSFKYGNKPLTFQISASNHNTVHNLCFEIKNWKSRTYKASLKINGITTAPGQNFRQGVTIDTDGTYTLIVWVGLSASAPLLFELF